MTFRWKDYTGGNQWRSMTLTAIEFLRRFVQHVLPRGFVRIRQFGYLASACRTARLTLAGALLARASPVRSVDDVSARPAGWTCPRCGAAMILGPILTARQLAAASVRFDAS